MIILLVIMLVFSLSQSIFIYNTAQSTIDTKKLEKAEMESFNLQFENYVGESISGSNVKALLSMCISNAGMSLDEERLPDIEYLDEENAGPEVSINKIISTEDDNNIELMSELRGKISSSHYYSVSLEYTDDGYIENIIIEY